MNKDNILKYVSEEEIMLDFLGLSDWPKNNLSSPFSKDKKPSFKLYRNKTFKCHSTGKQGDCWQLVADLNKINCKEDFKSVTNLICEKFSLNGYSKKEPKSINIEVNENENHFHFKTKDFEKIHLDYFNQGNWNVLQSHLEQYNVKALDKYKFWNSKKNEITKIKVFRNVIAFAYELGNSAELYQPKQEKANKFFLNKLDAKSIYGCAQLQKNQDFIIISAGKKDCLILNANGFPSVSFRSENHHVSKAQINILKKKTDKIFICYDNDTAGQKKVLEFVNEYNLTAIQLPSNYNDVADFFLERTKADFEEIIKNADAFSNEQKSETKPKSNEFKTIFHVVENYLKKHYDFRFNTIILDIESKPKGSKVWDICNEDSLYVEMQKKQINIQQSKLVSILRSDFVPKFNPIKEYFKELPQWDGQDYISDLCSYVSTPTAEDFEYHLKKWLARCVKCMLIDGYFNKQAFILTDKGNGQNLGKSHFTKWLTIPNLPVSRSFEDSKKDNLAKLATNTFIILDELDGISKKDINALKALFSYDEIRLRLPFAKRDSTIQRIANFIGSTNEESFLVDPTGSVRWLVFHVTAIDWNYSKKIDIHKIWAQAYALAKDVNFNESFTSNDVKNNEMRNQQYQVMSNEAELILKYFWRPGEAGELKDTRQFLTSTDIQVYIKANSSLRVTSVGVGRALKLLKYDKVKHKGVYGYWVVYQKRSDVSFNQL